jgi:hypothetical protein
MLFHKLPERLSGDVCDSARCESSHSEIEVARRGSENPAEVAWQREGHDPAATVLKHLIATCDAAQDEREPICGLARDNVLSGPHGAVA